jgi:hypothetical protein
MRSYTRRNTNSRGLCRDTRIIREQLEKLRLVETYQVAHQRESSAPRRSQKKFQRRNYIAEDCVSSHLQWTQVDSRQGRLEEDRHLCRPI